MVGKLLLRKVRTLKPGQAALEGLHDAVEHFWACAERQRSAAVPGERWQLEFVTALSEITGNVVRHAQPSGGVRLELSLYNGCVRATVLDRGKPFEQALPGTLAPLPDRLELLPEGGYGLRIAQTVLDSLEYSRVGGHINRWVLVKSWPAAAPGPP